MEQQSFVFPLATARLTLRSCNYLVARLAHEFADSRFNTRFPPSIPEILDRVAIVSGEDEVIRALS
jgi:hypothetical protein